MLHLWQSPIFLRFLVQLHTKPVIFCPFCQVAFKEEGIVNLEAAPSWWSTTQPQPNLHPVVLFFCHHLRSNLWGSHIVTMCVCVFVVMVNANKKARDKTNEYCFAVLPFILVLQAFLLPSQQRDPEGWQ